MNMALPQKSLQHGYAACVGFEDVALPFRTIGPFLPGLCPYGSSRFLGACGIAAKKRTIANGRASPSSQQAAKPFYRCRLTFEAKPMRIMFRCFRSQPTTLIANPPYFMPPSIATGPCDGCAVYGHVKSPSRTRPCDARFLRIDTRSL
jgi:hypothetical protein